MVKVDLYQGERNPDMGSEGSWKKRISWANLLGPFIFGFAFEFEFVFALGLSLLACLVVARALFLMLESFVDLDVVLVVGRLVLAILAVLEER